MERLLVVLIGLILCLQEGRAADKEAKRISEYNETSIITSISRIFK